MRKAVRGQRRIGPALLKMLPAALIAALIIHFGFTLIYLTPPNPIKLRTAPVVEA